MMKPYFKARGDQPDPLRVRIERTVRFEEVDSIGIVWHGRYASYFEDARVALGQKYGIGYMDFYSQGVIAPIKKMHFDYYRPLRFQETMRIEGILHWSEAARLNFEFSIRNGNGELSTTGYSVQMLLDTDGNILVVPPGFYEAFCRKWEAGELE
jgi:acyl-CoA thioester hydrolase